MKYFELFLRFTTRSSPKTVNGMTDGFTAANLDSHLSLRDEREDEEALHTEVRLPLLNKDDRTLDRLPELEREPGMPDGAGRGKPA